MKTKKIKALGQHHGDRFSVYHGDCVEVTKALPDNSIDLTVSSLPFSNLYCYSPSARDMGNTESDDHFFEHFSYLVPELHRVTVPGRIVVMHCKDLPLFMGSDGVAGLRDFPAEVSRAFTGKDADELIAKIEAIESVRAIVADQQALNIKIRELEDRLLAAKQNSFTLHSKVTIWKCPKLERERTNNSGLLHSQLCTDSSASRQGMAEYLLVFRKWDAAMNGLNSAKPVVGDSEQEWRFQNYVGTEPPPFACEFNPREYSIQVWRKYASPVWFDISPTDVLNSDAARAGDEAHMCPLQKTVIERCVELWSNPDDVVLDPFSGIGSTGVKAIEMGRRYVGVELNDRYFPQSIKYLSGANSFKQSELPTAIGGVA